MTRPPDKPPVFNYAFDCCASVESSLPFEDIPIGMKIQAMRQRLDDIEAEQNPEAFSEYDSYVVDESMTLDDDE